MDRGDWQVTVHGITRVGHDLVTKPPPTLITGEGNGTPLQYSCLENPMDKGAWSATVHEVTRVGHDLVTNPRAEKLKEKEERKDISI